MYTSINDVHYMIKAFSIYDAESDVIVLSCYISSNYEPSKSSDWARLWKMIKFVASEGQSRSMVRAGTQLSP